MINLKYLLVASLLGTSVFAQFAVDKESLSGKILLKDKAGTEMEINSDSKLTVEIMPSTNLDKLVLSNQYQIKLAIEKQETVYDVVKVTDNTISKDANGAEYRGAKDTNNQALHINCFITPKLKSELTYKKGTSSCIKTKECKGYVLGANKKFNLTDTTLCMGKKDVEVSNELATYDEVITCKLYDESEKEKLKTGIKFTFTRASDVKENHIKQIATSECK